MPDGAKPDGTIIVDTTIDTDGFNQDAKGLQKLLETLIASLDKLQQTMQKAFESDKSGIKEFSATTDEASARVKVLEDAVAKLSLENAKYFEIAQQYESMKTQLSELSEQYQKLNSSAKEAGEAAPAMAEKTRIGLEEITESGHGAYSAVSDIGSAIDTDGFNQDVKGLQKMLGSLGTNLNKMQQSLQMAFAGDRSGIKNFTAMAEKARAQIKVLEDALGELGSKRIATDAYKFLSDGLQEANDKLDQYKIKMDAMQASGVSRQSKEWRMLTEDIAKAEFGAQTFRDGMQQLESAGLAFLADPESEKYAAMAQQLENAKAQLSGMSEQYRELNSSASAAGSASAEMATKTSGSLSKLTAAGQKVLSVMGGIGSAIKSGLGSALSITAKAASGFASLAKSAGKAMAKMLGFNKTSSQSKDVIGGVSKSINGLIGTLKRLVIRKIMNAIVSGVKEGFTSLAAYSGQVNSELSALKSSLTQLQNSFATAFAPLLSVITPALVTFINYLSQAVTYVGMLIAALTGATTFTKATAVQEDFAESMSGSASAAKDLYNALLPIDELNIISEDAAAGGGGVSELNAVDMFEEVPIESWISQFADRLREAFLAGDYYGIGQIIGEEINKGLEWLNNNIKWENVQDNVLKAVNAITSAINGLVDTVDWYYLGETLGEGFNTVIYTLTAFLDGINWENVGKAIGSGINGLVDTVDWAALGALFAKKFNALVDTIYGIVTTLNWKNIGLAISDAVNGFFDTIDWVKLGKTIDATAAGIFNTVKTSITGINWESIGADIGNMLNGINWTERLSELGGIIGAAIYAAIQTVGTLARTFDYTDLGNGIAGAINSFFAAINWKEAGLSFSDSVLGILNTLKTAITETNWKEVGQSISDMITNIKWSEIVIELADLAMSLLNGVADAIKTVEWVDVGTAIADMLEAIPWTEVLKSAGNLIAAALGAVALIGLGLLEDKIGEDTSGKLGEIISEGMATGDTLQVAAGFASMLQHGIIGALEEPLIGIGYLSDHVVDPLMSRVAKAIFGYKIDSMQKTTSEKFEPIGKSLVEGTYKGAESELSTAPTWFSNNFGSVIESAARKSVRSHSPSEMFEEIGADLIAGLYNGTSGNWSDITNLFDTGTGDLETLFSGSWGNIETDAGGDWSSIKTTIADKWTNLKNDLSATTIKMKTDLSTTTTNIKTDISAIWDNLKTTLTATTSNLKTDLSTKWEDIKATLTTTATNIKTDLSTSWDGMKTTISEKTDGLKTSVKNSFDGLATDLKGMSWSGVGGNILDGIIDGMSAIGSKLKSWGTSLLNAAKKALDIESPSKLFRDEVGYFLGLGVAEGLEDSEGSIIKSVSQLADEMQSEFDKAELILDADTNFDKFINTVSGGLERFAMQLEAIGQLLDRIGGFTMPAIATGSVLPPRTIVASDGDGETWYRDEIARQSVNIEEQNTLLREQNDLLTQILEKPLTFNLDGAKIGSSTTSWQNNQGVSITRGAFALEY